MMHLNNNMPHTIFLTEPSEAHSVDLPILDINNIISVA